MEVGGGLPVPGMVTMIIRYGAQIIIIIIIINLGLNPRLSLMLL